MRCGHRKIKHPTRFTRGPVEPFVVGEGGLARDGGHRGSARTPPSPLMRALGINEENRTRIAVLVTGALGLVVMLQVCGTG